MAVTRDQAARVIRPEADSAEADTSGHATSGLGEQLRGHVADETKRLPADAPVVPSRPAGPPAAAPATEAPKSGKRRFVAMGIVGLLALAAASYAVYYAFVGRFYVSTDD